jgi:flagellar biogenesis protein FliO
MPAGAATIGILVAVIAILLLFIYLARRNQREGLGF